MASVVIIYEMIDFITHTQTVLSGVGTIALIIQLKIGKCRIVHDIKTDDLQAFLVVLKFRGSEAQCEFLTLTVSQ